MKFGNEKMNRLIHCFFDCYEYHLRGIDIRGLNSKKKTTHKRFTFLKQSKGIFEKAVYKLNLKEYTPFSNLKNSLQGQIKDIRNLSISEDEKLEKELELIEESAIKANTIFIIEVRRNIYNSIVYF